MWLSPIDISYVFTGLCDNEQTLPYVADIQTLVRQPHVQGKHVTQTIAQRDYSPRAEEEKSFEERRVLGKGGMGIVFEEFESLPE